MNEIPLFGSWLRQRRKALDLTQVDLADQVGCSVITIKKIEADERRPSKQITERMADVLAIASAERADFVAFARRSVASLPAPPVQRAAPTPSHNLPSQLSTFIGRADELAQIAKWIDNPACRLLTLVGPGGIGKTRLALQAASEQGGHWTHGVWLVPLAPLNTPDLLPAAIAGALQFSFLSTDDPKRQLLHYLRDKNLLLLLDNAEHLLEGIELLSDILA